jgi:non-specific serine/threonine protein kinase
MRNAIAWSYNLLTSEEQDLFRRLTVFVGSFSLEAAIALPSHPSGTIDSIGSLVEKSILQRFGDGDDPEPRYRMLETVREFGLGELGASGDEEAARQRHAAWYVDLAEAAEPELDRGDQVAWQDRLEADLSNLRSALAWSVEHDTDLALRLGASLRQFWIVRGNLAEAQRALAQALDSGAGEAKQRARTLLTAAWIRFAQADATACVELAETALDLYRRSDDRTGVTDALIAVGFGHDHGTTDASLHYSLACAIDALQEALVLARELGHNRNVALATYGIAAVAQTRGDVSQAIELYTEALAGFEQCDDKRSLAWTVSRIGVLAETMEDAPQAAACFARSLPIFHALRDWWSAVQIVTHVARLTLSAGRTGDSVQLLGAVNAFNDLEGMPPTADEHAARKSILEDARNILGEETCSAAFARGRSLSIEDAILHAHLLMSGEELPGETHDSGPSPDFAGLTHRERDVLRMLALGLTDRQIADRLSVSPRTVGGHVTNLLGKLEVESRTAAAVLAIRYGLD